MAYTIAQQDFIDQMTRKLMVDWCEQALTAPEGSDTFGVFVENTSPESPYIKYAISKKWIKEDGVPRTTAPRFYKVLSPGYDTAQRFLKR